MKLAFVLSAVFALATVPMASGSDHGDVPQANGIIRQDANLTDLYAFLSGENLVIALCSNPAIPPGLTSYIFPGDVTFEINLDNHSAVNGGAVADPAKIQEDFTIRIQFDDSGVPLIKKFVRGGNPSELPIVKFFAGLRDDPFIRAPREGRNVAAIVFEVPLEAVTPLRSTLLIWATSKVEGFKGPIQDLVGRALRSMMPENADMNSMEPRHHERKMQVGPDVMIYDTDAPATFPNGRKLEDDVVDLVNDPRILANDAPFPSVNDVPFLSEFPYLAPPQ